MCVHVCVFVCGCLCIRVCMCVILFATSVYIFYEHIMMYNNDICETCY